MKTSRFLLPFIATFAISTALPAQDKGKDQDLDRSQPEPARLMEMAVKAKQEGRYEESQALYEQAKRLEGEARGGKRKKERPEPFREEQIAKAKQEIEELRREGRNEEAEIRIRRLKNALEREQGAFGKEKDEEIPQKIRHIMEAVHHLRAAGMKEPAEQLEQQARRLKEEFEQQGRQKEKQLDGDRAAALSREVDVLREQMQRMAQEMNKMREELKKSRGEEPGR